MSILTWRAPSINQALKYAAAAVFLLALAGCAGMGAQSNHASHTSEEMADHGAMTEITADGLTISKAMAAAAPLSGGNGAVYMTIRSESADQFTGAESPAAAMVELHESIDDNGVMRMEPHPDGFEIPAGNEIELKQGGKHIMLMNLTEALEAGDEIELTLNFRDHESVTITVPVMTMGEMKH